MSDKKSAKKKDSKDSKDKKSTEKEASKKKGSAKKDSKSSSTPKSSKESTSTSAVKGSKKSKDPQKPKDPKDPKDSKKSKGSKGSKDKDSKKKDSKDKSSKKKNSKDKSSKKKDSKKTSKRPSVQLAKVRELLDDSGSASTEHRVLVDRLWPRGVKKERLAHDDWDKDVAPSPDLRKAFHGGDLNFDDFRDHYLRELSDSEAPQQLLDSAARVKAKTIVLVYGAKDAERNHAQVLADHLRTLSKN